MTGTLESLTQERGQTHAPSDDFYRIRTLLKQCEQLLNFELNWHGLIKQKTLSVVTACQLTPVTLPWSQ